MKLTQRYETKLETSKRESIGAILDSKLESTTPEQLTDYISLAVDNLTATIERMSDAEKELKAMKKDAQNQIDLIKVGSAEWLCETGIITLKGDIVSSMKVTEPKEKETLIITCGEDELINQGYFKTTLDRTAIKNSIKDGVNVEGAELEITHQEQSLTIYKKRKLCN